MIEKAERVYYYVNDTYGLCPLPIDSTESLFLLKPLHQLT